MLKLCQVIRNKHFRTKSLIKKSGIGGGNKSLYSWTPGGINTSFNNTFTNLSNVNITTATGSKHKKDIHTGDKDQEDMLAQDFSSML